MKVIHYSSKYWKIFDRCYDIAKCYTIKKKKENA